MTTSRQFSDIEGDFAPWKDHPEPCRIMVPQGELPLNRPLVDPRPTVRCNAKVRYRSWESSDGAYDDYQYRCENGHHMVD